MSSLVESLRQLRRVNADAVLTIAHNRPWTRAVVDDRSTSAACGLLAAGLAPGDRVAIHLTNGIDVVVAYYACFKAGLIAVPIDTRLRAPEIDYILRHSAARAYIGQLEVFADADAASRHIALRYLIGDNARPQRSFSELVATHGDDALLPAVPIDAPAILLYPSDMTVRPKGVTHTHGSLQAEQCQKLFGVPLLEG
ncbi:MAG: AMP-binding protein [Cyanobacteria bacterium]|nr:AMP-binding protein [Cyanobacteriota bacterium]